MAIKPRRRRPANGVTRSRKGDRRPAAKVAVGGGITMMAPFPDRGVARLSAIAMPVPDQRILARRDEIIAGLAEILGKGGVIVAEDERRAYETDALTAYRAVPLA